MLLAFIYVLLGSDRNINLTILVGSLTRSGIFISFPFTWYALTHSSVVSALRCRLLLSARRLK